MTRPSLSLSLSLGAAALLLALNTAPAYAADAPADDKAGTAELERARAEFKRAQEELARAAREMARVSRELNLDSPRAFAYEFVADPDRAMLGSRGARGTWCRSPLRATRPARRWTNT